MRAENAQDLLVEETSLPLGPAGWGKQHEFDYFADTGNQTINCQAVNYTVLRSKFKKKKALKIKTAESF